MQKQIEQTLTSLEVAEMLKKQHKNLLADIRGYIKELNQLKIQPVDFFQNSVYIDNKGEQRPCYNLTKKGCEFVAHKLTGIKGTEFTAIYINRFHDMEEMVKEGISEKKPSQPKKKNLSSINMMIKNVNDIFSKAGVDPLYIAVAAKNIYEEAGYNIPIQLTTKEKKLYDCTEMAKELGVLSESGKLHDKAISGILQQIDILEDEKITTPYERKGHSGVTVQYKESVFQKVRQWLIDNSYPTEIPLLLCNGKTNKCKVAYKNVEVA